jgi:UDP-N-acetylmuramoylalanine--D-glutamate ligase
VAGRPLSLETIDPGMRRYFPTTSLPWLWAADRTSPWSSAHAVVGGIGVTGYAAATALLGVGAEVTVVADSEPTGAAAERAGVVEALGGRVRSGPGVTASIPPGTDLVVISPGFLPTSPLVQAAIAAGVPVFTDLDLARRLEDPGHRPAWLCITGSNGKTTTTGMLASILQAAGERAFAVGNIGASPLDAVLDPEPPSVLAVEVSAQQLHYSPGLSPQAAVVLNLAPDHLEFFGGMGRYVADKGRVYDGTELACVYNVDDPATERLVRDADVVEGARAIGFTLGIPSVSQLGVVDGVLADRAFIEDRYHSAVELLHVDDLPTSAPHVVANALAAAALARAHGVSTTAVRDGLRGFRLDRHRIEDVGEFDGIRYVNDSKATNPHAALASLNAYDPIVWIAGGQAKNLTFDDLVTTVAGRLRGVVLLGTDRAVIADALARHAPQVPVIDVPGRDHEAMTDVVAAARRLARPGDTVLLAPGCASYDMFSGYAGRGDAFVAAVRDQHGKR